MQFSPTEVLVERAAKRIPTLTELLKYTPEELHRFGLAGISLVCSTGLLGAEDVHIPDYLARVKEWAAYVRKRLPGFVHAFRDHPAEFNNSEAFFFMKVLVQILKTEMGIHYNPARVPPSELTGTLGWNDSRDLLIHGPLGSTRAGTCNNIPMAVVAVARELGCPVYLAATASHVYAKWVGSDGYTFNIEAANPAGMTSHTDEHYRDDPLAAPELLGKSSYYLRPFNAVDELALCLMSRGWVLEAQDRYAEACFAHAHACPAGTLGADVSAYSGPLCSSMDARVI